MATNNLYMQFISPAPSPVVIDKIPPVPAVGDWVVITPGHKNWNLDMVKWVGKVARIKSLTPGYGARFEKINEAINHWNWQYEHGHYRMANEEEMNGVVVHYTDKSGNIMVSEGKTEREAIENAVELQEINYVINE